MAAPLQSKNWGSVASGSATAFNSPVTQGSLLVVGFRLNSFITTATVSDDVNGAWTRVGALMNAGGIGFAFYYRENAAAGTTTLTLNSPDGTGIRAQMAEYGGVITSGALDKFAQDDTGVSTSPSSGATATRTQANELLVGFLGTATGGDTPFVAGSGFTLRQANADVAVQLEDQTVSATGTDAATFTLNASDNWACLVATFKLAGAGMVPGWLMPHA